MMELDFTVDFNAADPSRGAKAPNAKEADRKNWFGMYMEQGVNYRFPIQDIPCTFSMFLRNQTDFMFFPDFHGDKNWINGRLSQGFTYTQEFVRGGLYSVLGLPLSYLSRDAEGIRFGMELIFGYHTRKEIGIGIKLLSATDFVPVPIYGKTEFVFTWAWKDFEAELGITEYGPFDDLMIRPEMRYNFDGFTFKLGVEVSRILQSTTYSPYMGLAWNF
jgi:hypothetical protein